MIRKTKALHGIFRISRIEQFLRANRVSFWRKHQHCYDLKAQKDDLRKHSELPVGSHRRMAACSLRLGGPDPLQESY